jgi:hypothetical protein
MEKVETQIPLTLFITQKLQVLLNRPRFGKGQPFEFGLGSRLIRELRSSAKGSKNPMT